MMSQTQFPSSMTAWEHQDHTWQCGCVRVINTTDCWRVEKMYPGQFWWTLLKCSTDFLDAIEYAEEIEQ